MSRTGQPRPEISIFAAVLHDRRKLLGILDAFVTHLGLPHVDLMDLSRAGEVARVNALGRGELLFESDPGMFAEAQIAAIVRHADTQWLRDLELQLLQRQLLEHRVGPAHAAHASANGWTNSTGSARSLSTS